jgi:hypothetical protein
MDVQTREGIFGGGAYGGGVFDGSNMGFGALGRTSESPMAFMGLGLSSSPTYTWQTGDTGTSVAKALTGNGNRWTELAAANPAHKCATYGFCAKAGDVVTLPASWVAATAAAPVAQAIPANDVAFLIDVVNSILYDWGMSAVPVATKLTPALCGGVEFIASQLNAGKKIASEQDADDLKGLWDDYESTFIATCGALKPWPAPTRTGTPAVPSQPSTGAPVCSVVFGTKAPVVAILQATMNDILVQDGYKPIPLSGEWDAITCGAMFALRGAWDPSGDPRLASLCPGGWQVPPACPKGVTPIVPTKDEDAPTKSSTATAWMLGGLLGTAALAGLYVSTRKI